MNNEKLTREDLMATQYAMLKEIHKCCEENGITYYLAYGTLIGAVRHQGFIPWDDDLDIMMSVEEFEKLRHVYKSDRFFLTDCFHNNGHQLCFPRMYDGYTCRDGNESLGVFVDIYLIHGTPNDEYHRARHILSIMRMNNLRKFVSKWVGRVKRHFLPFLWKETESSLVVSICKMMYKSLCRYDPHNSECVFAFGGKGIVELFWKASFDEIVSLPFQDGLFYAPKGYHEVLFCRYGDYMKLPPEKDRHPYHGSDHFYWRRTLETDTI